MASTPAKSPAAKSASKKKSNNNPLQLPGLDRLPAKKGGKPVVVVVVKGGGARPNLSNLPFILPGTKKKKGKKGSKKKKTSKKEAKKKATKTDDDDEDSDSDRMSAPEIPKAHSQKPGSRSDRSSTSTTSAVTTPEARTPKSGAKTPKKGTQRGVKTKDQVIIKDGIVDTECVPMFVLIDGPAGCPIIIPLDSHDSSGLISEIGPQPLLSSPSQPTKGYLLLSDDSLLHFKPLKDCPSPPPSSTPGTLHKFLTNSNIFIADSGPQLPDDKSYTRGGTAPKDKIGQKIAVSGHITILPDKGTCKFTRVLPAQSAPFYPTNAAMGVLVRDQSSGFVFWVPTEDRFVGPLLSQNVSIPSKQVAEMTIVSHIFRDSSGLITCQPTANKTDELMGFILSSSTGVPIYAAKPEPVAPRPSTSIRRPVISPTPLSITPSSAASPSPSPSSPADPSIPAAGTVDVPSIPAASPPAAPTAAAAPVSPPAVSTPPKPAAVPVGAAASAAPPAPSKPSDDGPSFGWSLLSTLGSVLNTTASVITTTATAVSEVTAAAGGAGATLPPPQESPRHTPPQSPPPSKSAQPSQSTSSPPPSSDPLSKSAPPAQSPSMQPVPVPVPVVANRVQTTKPTTPTVAVPAASRSSTVAATTAPAATPADAAPAATPADAAPAVQVSVRVSVADASSNGPVRDSTSNGGCESDHKSCTDRTDGESDQLSEGGLSIGDQMASIYRNLLESQNELPPEPDSHSEQLKEDEKEKEKQENSRNSKEHIKEQGKEQRGTEPSMRDEARRKAENTKEYKKFLDDRSVSFSPFGYR